MALQARTISRILFCILIYSFVFSGCQKTESPTSPPADNTIPPEVYWLNPVSQARGETILHAIIESEKRIITAKFFVDGTMITELSDIESDTLEFIWDSNSSPDGPHSLELRVWNSEGQIGITPGRTVLVINNETEDESAATLEWINPPQPPWTGEVTLRFRVTGDVDTLTFHRDALPGVLHELIQPSPGDTSQFILDTQTLHDGLHLLYAKLKSTQNDLSYSLPLPAEVRNSGEETPPVLAWIDPPDEALEGIVDLRLHIQSQITIQKLTFHLDGSETTFDSLMNPGRNQAIWSFNSESVRDGYHLITARTITQSGVRVSSPALQTEIRNTNVNIPSLQWRSLPESPWTGEVALTIRIESENQLDAVTVYRIGNSTPIDSIPNPEINTDINWQFDSETLNDGVHTFYAILYTQQGDRYLSQTLAAEIRNNTAENQPMVYWVDAPEAPWRDEITTTLRVESNGDVPVLYLMADTNPFPIDSLQNPPLGNDIEWTFDTQLLDEGVHLLYAEAHTETGLSGRSLPLPAEIRNADRTAPIVRWDYPEAGTAMSGLVGIPFRVMDEGGIRDIEVFVNGQEGNGTIEDSVGINLYRYVWDSSGYPDGYVNFEILVRDSSGNEASSPTLLASTLNQGLPRVIYVPVDAPTLQSAINESRSGDTIRVAQGTYYEGLNFFGKNVWFESIDGPEVTIIDADDWTYGIVIVNGEDSTLTIRGITVRNAIANGFQIEGSSYRIFNSVSINHTRMGNAGISDFGGAQSRIENCIFDHNRSGLAISYSWGTYYNCISINSTGYGIWNYATLNNPLSYGYNLYFNNENNFNNPPLRSQTDLLSDPRFEEGNYQLSGNSPCIDRGNPEILDRDGTRSDIGVYGGPYAYDPPN